MFKRLFITALFLSVGLAAHAGHDAVTPYGDYCRECTTYGTCKDPIPPKAAIAAIVNYYGEKGYTVGRVRHKGRFVEAEIYKGNMLVDKVLFDRKTGRIRSVM
ncbi:MAG: hypothetical protein OEW04_01760 [Nitrospirota bacterium]|nr:hypothetical protein [Nitrospirota bacterium]